ncbi:MAG: sugar nucleotide-binding protein, partial [Ignavibacteriaceae bacterium]
MKVLITGGSGLLGSYLNNELSKTNEILSVYYRNSENSNRYNSQQIDIMDEEKLHTLFNSFRPAIVIHTAAMTNPILSPDIDPKAIYIVNVNSTKKIAELCNKYSAKLIYTSSDLVYAGYRGSMLNEESKLIPVSLYAETKLMGEIKIQETFDNYLNLRIALLYGFGLGKKKNHFEEMYNNLKAGNTVKLFHDQYRTPLSLTEAARIINELCNKNIKSEVIN